MSKKNILLHNIMLKIVSVGHLPKLKNFKKITCN